MRREKPDAPNVGTWIETDDRRGWRIASPALLGLGDVASNVQRIWRAHELKPHLVKTFKVSRDKNFAAKVEDVVGLYHEISLSRSRASQSE